MSANKELRTLVNGPGGSSTVSCRLTCIEEDNQLAVISTLLMVQQLHVVYVYFKVLIPFLIKA